MKWRALALAIGFFPAAAGAVCVSAFQTRLRAEPSGNAKVTWVVGRYTPLVELERRGGWIKVKDQDGETHWVQASDVTPRGRCVAVRVKSAPLRTGPSTRSARADLPSADRYTAFKRIEADPVNWYLVEDEAGGRYWISAGNVWRPTSVNRIGF